MAITAHAKGALIVGLTCTGLAGTAFVARHVVLRQQWNAVLEVSEGRVLNNALTAPKGAALLFGDSLTARTFIISLCGRPALNAAIGGTAAPQDLSFVRTVAARVRPSVTVLAWGANDAVTDSTADFIARFDRMLHAVAGPKIVVGIWPMEAGANRNADFIAHANRELAGLARKYGAAYVAPPEHVKTVDGLHPTPVELLRRAEMIEARCKQLELVKPSNF